MKSLLHHYEDTKNAPHKCLNLVQATRHRNRALPHDRPTSREGRGLRERTRRRREATRATRGSRQEGNANRAVKTCGTRTYKLHRIILWTVGYHDIVRTKIIHISTSTLFFLWTTAHNRYCAQQLSVWMSKKSNMPKNNKSGCVKFLCRLPVKICNAAQAWSQDGKSTEWRQ